MSEHGNLITLCPNHHADAHWLLAERPPEIDDAGEVVMRPFDRASLVEAIIDLGPQELNFIFRRRAHYQRERQRRQKNKEWAALSPDEQDRRIVTALNSASGHLSAALAEA